MTSEQIMRACQHEGRRDSEMKGENGEIVRACWRCGNAAIAAHRAERRAALAARPKDCQRCGVRPHTWSLGRFRLCGRCKTETLREHRAALSHVGALAIFATDLLVDTSGWKGAGR